MHLARAYTYSCACVRALTFRCTHQRAGRGRRPKSGALFKFHATSNFARGGHSDPSMHSFDASFRISISTKVRVYFRLLAGSSFFFVPFLRQRMIAK